IFADIWMIIPASIKVVGICEGMNVLAAVGTTKSGAFTAIKLRAQSSGCLETIVADRRVRISKMLSNSETTRRAASRLVVAASKSNSGWAISTTISADNRGSILFAKYRKKIRTTKRSMRSSTKSLDKRTGHFCLPAGMANLMRNPSQFDNDRTRDRGEV